MIQNNNKKVNIFVSNVRTKIFDQHLILNTAKASVVLIDSRGFSPKEPEQEQNKAQPVVVTDLSETVVFSLEGTDGDLITQRFKCGSEDKVT